MRLIAVSNIGEIILSTERAPNHGKMSFSNREMILLEWLSFQLGTLPINHSRAIISKLLSANIRVATFFAFLVSPGSAPFANNLRACSRRSRAKDKLIAGYTPSASVFCFPAKR